MAWLNGVSSPPFKHTSRNCAFLASECNHEDLWQEFEKLNSNLFYARLNKVPGFSLWHKECGRKSSDRVKRKAEKQKKRNKEEAKTTERIRIFDSE